ncbi:hypothetical protein QQF64_028762 [Cirrhinus molitorella]|uniref:Uncharacterized protein n=1 Tax=Cirrhinus molitorella TaxID=172907 RepID=A0ABR3N7K0_9TELE
MGTVYLATDLNLGLNTPDHLDTRDEGDGQKGTRAREEEENQFLMTILCAPLKAREFLSPGKVAVGDGG